MSLNISSNKIVDEYNPPKENKESILKEMHEIDKKGKEYMATHILVSLSPDEIECLYFILEGVPARGKVTLPLTEKFKDILYHIRSCNEHYGVNMKDTGKGLY